ncbi:hypothetical protein B0T22DRAFT_465379 [Podospora appendiculata]|uniref:Uncharacterized protein n=1 Tax=Podospora appendiculata TaxID=314037 RepID=A0AAE0X585_9PEZI|nr:hypothetical protein B0T22DRAFT_465379 [Podospora appendiculata]
MLQRDKTRFLLPLPTNPALSAVAIEKRYKPLPSPCPHPLHTEADLLNEANQPIKLAGGLNRLADRLTPAGWMCCVDRTVFPGGIPAPQLSCLVGPHQYKKLKGRVRRHLRAGGDEPEPDSWQPCRRCYVVNRYQETLSFLDRTLCTAAVDGQGVQKVLDGLPDGALREHWVHYAELVKRGEEGLRWLAGCGSGGSCGCGSGVWGICGEVLGRGRGSAAWVCLGC